MLQFPFWLVVPASKKGPSYADGCGSRALALTFSSVGKMATFLTVQKLGQWNVRLVNRYSAEALFKDLEERSYGAVCHDANEDGTGGSVVSMADILASLRADLDNHSPD